MAIPVRLLLCENAALIIDGGAFIHFENYRVFVKTWYV
jgi:hypothetical protein